MSLAETSKWESSQCDHHAARASGAPEPRRTSADAVVAASSSTPVIADPVMRRLHRMAEQAAATDISVLLLGESGSGKEILAEAVHRHSPRCGRPFLRVHCAAVPENLLESELFGHEKGAFSGATHTKAGLLEAADGGTVFLDEIGDMPLSLQPKLLRVLEDHQVLRLGSLHPRSVDVRFVAATNRNLEEDSRLGRFRLDLYYRLNGFCLELPPLRQRIADIEPLAHLFLRRATESMRRASGIILTRDALDLLVRYSWPGNVRELRNVIERAVILAGDGTMITPEHLPLALIIGGIDGPMAGLPAGGDLEPGPSAPLSERDRIVEALARCGGNQSAAAKLLGMSRNWLIARVRTYGLPRPQGHRQARR